MKSTLYIVHHTTALLFPNALSFAIIMLTLAPIYSDGSWEKSVPGITLSCCEPVQESRGENAWR